MWSPNDSRHILYCASWTFEAAQQKISWNATEFVLKSLLWHSWNVTFHLFFPSLISISLLSSVLCFLRHASLTYQLRPLFFPPWHFLFRPFGMHLNLNATSSREVSFVLVGSASVINWQVGNIHIILYHRYGCSVVLAQTPPVTCQVLVSVCNFTKKHAADYL